MPNPAPHTCQNWWDELPLSEAQKVCRRNIAMGEYRRLKSERAARTWWNTLSAERRDEVFDFEHRG